MIRYVFRRILLMIPVLLGVTLFIFALQSFTPGDPAAMMLGSDSTELDRWEWREMYDLNDPVLVQYGKYMFKLLKGDFGVSYRTSTNVTTTILQRWPTTFLVALLSVSVSVILGMVLGIIQALHRNDWIDSAARFLAMIGISMPNFWFALLLIMLFSLKLKWLPVSGFSTPKHWVLPIATLGILGSAGMMRITRSSMLDNLGADFVRTARSKGQTEGKIVLHHVLRNALIPIITSIGGYFAVSLGGTIVIEQIFSISGLGRLMIDAINTRDYPLLRGAVLLIAVTASVINLIVDVMYAAVDPRVKATFKNSVKPMKLFKKKDNK